MRQGLVQDEAEKDAKAADGWNFRENGERRGKHRKWSPVKGARQEVGGRA